MPFFKNRQRPVGALSSAAFELLPARMTTRPSCRSSDRRPSNRLPARPINGQPAWGGPRRVDQTPDDSRPNLQKVVVSEKGVRWASSGSSTLAASVSNRRSSHLKNGLLFITRRRQLHPSARLSNRNYLRIDLLNHVFEWMVQHGIHIHDFGTLPSTVTPVASPSAKFDSVAGPMEFIPMRLPFPWPVKRTA